MGLADGRQDQQEELILQRLHPNGVADLLAPVGGEMEREKERGPISQVGRTVSAMLSVVGNAVPGWCHAVCGVWDAGWASPWVSEESLHSVRAPQDGDLHETT